MNTDKSGKFWLLAAFLLVLIIFISTTIIWLRRDQGSAIAILPPEPTVFSGQILVEGAVNRPGIYPLQAGDNIQTILQASGGTMENADLSRTRLYIATTEDIQESQKVDINRAAAWMLEALPDIGTVRAEAIIGYREQNGPFSSTSELTNVAGITSSTFQKIKDMIEVGN